MFILESDGSAAYTITEYSSAIHAGESVQRPPQVYKSSHVIKREYGYVFYADFPEDCERGRVFLIHRATMPDYFGGERLEWNADTDSPLGGITPDEAETRAKNIEERIYRNIGRLGYAGGWFLRDAGVDTTVDSERLPVHYRTVGAVVLDDNFYFVVYANSDLEALNRGEHGGSVTAVGLNGRLVFYKSMVGGEWIFIDDAGQTIIVPSSP